MTNYRLKDHELQEKLEAIDTYFGENLNDSMREPNCQILEHVYVPFTLTGQSSIDMSPLKIALTEVEAYEEYNHNKWNNYPEAVPPKNVWMRATDSGGHGFRAKYKGSDVWLDDLDCRCKVVRFRPWEY